MHYQYTLERYGALGTVKIGRLFCHLCTFQRRISKKSLFHDDVPELILRCWYLDEYMESEKDSVIAKLSTLYTIDLYTLSRIFKKMLSSAFSAPQSHSSS